MLKFAGVQRWSEVVSCAPQSELLKKMMVYQPADRITAVQALQHEFFATPEVAKQEAALNGNTV